MRLLLDTHAYLWWLSDDDRLPLRAREAISSAASIVHVSAATVWEAMIKVRLGRLDLAGADLTQEIHPNGFVELPINAQHAAAAAMLPLHHHDPFDRMLIAQAQLEQLALVTTDTNIASYDIATVW